MGSHTHSKDLARAVCAAADLTYQQALAQVRVAQAAGAVPAVRSDVDLDRAVAAVLAFGPARPARRVAVVPMKGVDGLLLDRFPQEAAALVGRFRLADLRSGAPAVSTGPQDAPLLLTMLPSPESQVRQHLDWVGVLAAADRVLVITNDTLSSLMNTARWLDEIVCDPSEPGGAGVDRRAVLVLVVPVGAKVVQDLVSSELAGWAVAAYPDGISAAA
jgi:hypothetical protein